MIKKLLESVREYKKSSILTPIFMVFEVLLEVLIPFLMAGLIDYGINEKNMNYIVKMGGILILTSFGSLFFGAMAGKMAAKASCGFAKNLRQDMFYKISDYSFSNIDRFSSSSLVTRLTTDVTNIQNSYQMCIRMAFRAPAMLIFAMIMSFTVNVKLSLVFLVVVPILGFSLIFIVLKVHPIFIKVFKTYDRLNEVVGENLHGVRVVKSYVREEHENTKFKKISEVIYQKFSKAEKLLALNMPIMQFCMYLCMILISWFAAKMIVASGNNPDLGMTTGQLMSMMTYVMQILMSLMMLSMVFVTIVISKASAERIVEVLNEKSDITSKNNAIKIVNDGSIVFKNVDFAYSKTAQKNCLENINLDIKSGETIGIIGGTGSAKSSLIQLISRLYDVTKGSVLVGGVDVKDYDIEALRQEVSVVLQKNVLFSGTIRDNLKWGNEKATDEEIIKACKLAQADSFIQQFPEKYDTYIEQGGSNVSGGQKQRICIARALLKKPKILILDDSTSAVDTKTDALIREAFLKEIPETTKLIVAQRIASVSDADKIIVMEDGHISSIGTHEELLEKSEIYKEVYDSQVKVVTNDAAK